MIVNTTYLYIKTCVYTCGENNKNLKEKRAHYVFPTMPNGSKRTSLRPKDLILQHTNNIQHSALPELGSAFMLPGLL